YISPSPSQPNTATPGQPGPNIAFIIGATVGSVLFALMVLVLGYRYLWTKPKHIDPYLVEYTKPNELKPPKFCDCEGSQSDGDSAPPEDPVQAPSRPTQTRIHRHEDSGWRPQALGSEPEGGDSNLIELPPEYENAL
ncbi:hypothetical protein VNI00_014197, partial [Paramarasmius palmivorus]